MKKKIFIGIALLILSIFLGTSAVFANEGEKIVNDIRDGVGKAEDTVENAAKDTAGAVREGFNKVGEAGQDVADDAKDMAEDTKKGWNDKMDNGTVVGSDNRTNYNATRTSADNATFNGMTANGWIWTILALAAVGIIALVWYYIRQEQTSRNNRR